MDRINNNLDPNTKTYIIKISCVVIVIGTAGYVGYYFYRQSCNESLIKKKRKELDERKDSLLKKLESLETPINNMEKITSLKLSDVMNAMESGIYKPIDILQAYQAKALIKDKEFNFITDLNPNVDTDVLGGDTSKRGLLKGIPVSVKECFLMKGCDSTYGMLDRIYCPADHDDMMVRTLRLQGMVPFVATNMCQSGLSIESSNPVFGKTLNPFNKTRTCGGSSGGEGAILGCGASLVGLGSDIGGSIRIPSSYCGVFGLKPTAQRFSLRHSKYLYPKQNIINVSVGPMARRIEDLVAVFKAMACGDLYHLDPYCPPLCFNDKIFDKKRPLRIGYYIHLGENQVTPVPAVVRAVEIAKKALESAGHVLIEFNIPDIDYAIFDLYFQCLFTDGGKGFVGDFINNNPIDPTIAYTTKLLKLPNFLKRIVSWLIYPFDKNRSRALFSMSGLSSAYSLWELKDKIKNYREKVLLKWQEQRLDGLICPVLPICAPPLNTSSDIMDIVGYTAIFNLLDYPAGSSPVTKVTKEDIDELLRSYPKNNRTHRKIIECQKDSIGMPVGVQSVSMLWREETCLRIMRDISKNIPQF